MNLLRGKRKQSLLYRIVFFFFRFSPAPVLPQYLCYTSSAPYQYPGREFKLHLKSSLGAVKLLRFFTMISLQFIITNLQQNRLFMLLLFSFNYSNYCYGFLLTDANAFRVRTWFSDNYLRFMSDSTCLMCYSWFISVVVNAVKVSNGFAL